MAKKKVTSQHEKISSAKTLIETHLNGHLTPLQLQSRLNRQGMNYTKITRNSGLIFIIRGDGIERTELTFQGMDSNKRNEYLNKMKSLQDNIDTEVAHAYADGILCDILNELGYSDIVEAWEQIDKWYA